MASESQRVYDENLSQFLTVAPLHLGGHPRSQVDTLLYKQTAAAMQNRKR